jgi:hypothetical protein
MPVDCGHATRTDKSTPKTKLQTMTPRLFACPLSFPLHEEIIPNTNFLVDSSNSID